jgi:DNA modification methylase
VNDRAAYANANATRLPLADKSVHMIATSPPYWGLRSYDTGPNKAAELGAEKVHDCLAWARHEEPCGACYVCNLRTWATEMWRVLRDDGVMFLNLADSYAGGGNGGGGSFAKDGIRCALPGTDKNKAARLGNRGVTGGLKAKDMAGIPWRVALALQADGWYLRSDCIWEKPNAMPSSVTDRPSTSHEYIFLLTKRARYYWDAEAVKEPQSKGANGSRFTTGKTGINGNGRVSSLPREESLYRNLRTVWTINTAPYSGAHFATWPPALVERMVKAGSSERGVCPECGAPWQRVVDKGEAVNAPRNPNDALPYTAGGATNHGNGATTLHKVRTVETVEWRPTCAHADASPIPAIVLDPFCGSGTTLLVARQLGRRGLGFDLSETYLRDNAATRLGHDQLAAWGRGIVDTSDYSDLFRAHANGHGATE